MKDQVIVGIDPSLGSAAICVGVLGKYKGVTTRTFNAGKSAPELEERIQRWVDHAANIIEGALELLRPIRAKVGVILIEDYSFGSRGRAILDLAEFGGILRLQLLKDFSSINIKEVSPKSLKKFIAGNGNADKTKMVSVLARKYQADFETNDEYDAFGLYLLGQAILDPKYATTASQREVLKKL
jgi:Holliday junction resolvasome RuvABC endonuclease subunit